MVSVIYSGLMTAPTLTEARTEPLGRPIKPPTAKSGYMPTLDGWRAVAIFLVIFYHGNGAPFEQLGHVGQKIADLFKIYGLYGVYLFFPLSGFLITSRILEEFKARGELSLKGFYIRRASRILPPAMTFLFALALLGFAGIVPVTLKGWLSSALSISNYWRTSNWYNGHFWSLAMEEHFYLLWPTLLVIFGIRKGWRTALVLAVAVAAYRFLNYKFLFVRMDGPYAMKFMERTDFQADALLWGCVFAFVYADPQGRQRLAALGSTWVYLALTAVMVFTFLYHPHNWMVRQAQLMLNRALIPAIMAIGVANASSIPARILELSPMRFIGRLSYSLYLWQQLFFCRPAEALQHVGPLQHIPWNLICALALAFASYHLIERPFIRLGHRLAKPVTEGRSVTREWKGSLGGVGKPLRSIRPDDVPLETCGHVAV